MNRFLSLLQFADGLFPAGAYAHSFGLEPACNPAKCAMPWESRHFCARILEGCAGPTDAVALVCARRAAAAQNLASCVGLDEMLDAMKTAERITRRQPPDGQTDAARGDSLAMPSDARRIWPGRCRGNHAGPSPDCFWNDRWRSCEWDALEMTERLSLLDKLGPGWRGPAPPAAAVGGLTAWWECGGRWCD